MISLLLRPWSPTVQNLKVLHVQSPTATLTQNQVSSKHYAHVMEKPDPKPVTDAQVGGSSLSAELVSLPTSTMAGGKAQSQASEPRSPCL